MTKTYGIYGKHIELEIHFVTRDVKSHSILSDPDNPIGRELREAINNGMEYTRGLIKSFEEHRKKELEKVGQ